jgi:hypothetical protein
MPDNLVRFLIDNIGRPHPCDLCGRPSTQLREVWLPGAIIFDGRTVVRSARYVCPACPG